MKWVDWFKEKCTWLNLLYLGYLVSLGLFLSYLVEMLWAYGFDTPPIEVEYDIFSNFMCCFVFRYCIFEDKIQTAREQEKEMHNEFVEETVLIIEEMRDEIEQLKQNKESKEWLLQQRL